MRKNMTWWMMGTMALSVSAVAVVRADERAGKESKAAVTFRAATSTATPDFEKMTLENGEVVYVSPRVTFTNDEVVSALRGAGRNDLDLTITSDAADRIGRGEADRVAVFVKGRLTAAPTMTNDNEAGRVSISNLSDAELTRLSGLLGASTQGMVGATMRIVPRQTSAQPGDIVTVDVFVSGAPNLRTFQFALDAVGGRSGELTRELGRIEEQRADFAFGSARAIKAVDDSRGRAGGTLFEGHVDATQPMYVGTFDYKVSDDASGSFVIKIRMDDDSFLHNEENYLLGFTPINATIKVGAAGGRSNR